MNLTTIPRSRTRWQAVLPSLAILCAAVLPGCQSRTDIAPITEWKTYDDPYVHFSFSYPANWNVDADGGTITVTSTSDAAAKFLDPTSNAPDGAQVVVNRIRMDSLETADAHIAGFAAELTAAGFAVERVSGRTLAGEAAAAVRYSGAYSKDTKLRAERVAIVKDSMLYTVHVGMFNEYADACASLIDSVVASFALAHEQTPAAGIDPALPSTTFATFTNFAVSMKYPENFEPSIPSTRKGEALFSMDVRGYRQDCTIHLDILPAKGLTVDKLVEQNLKFYKATSRGETRIDGQRALYLSYAPAKNVQSRVYFIVKGDKFARVIMNVFTPLKAEFLPSFERSIGSISIK